MLKFLLMAVVALVLWKVLMPGDRSRNRPSSRKPEPSNEPDAPQEMVACAHCGLHLPEGDALSEPTASGQPRHYCCDAHRRAGPRTPQGQDQGQG